jgi:hypothetical protein
MATGCGTVEIRRQHGKVTDVMVVAPAKAPAYVVNKGKGLSQGTYVIAGNLPSGSQCAVFGASGSGSSAVVSATLTKDSGTPYAVNTISVVG